ncbi:hypothetical protein HRG_008479 [Hirsutella rhossiliensis]|uniref:Uncharacterized protein n=1 Tax=Hirsutella rhossiliensis TaxID=111463 RepID=A0A9P8MSG0_9HYPO|nr:uncharacterized protein HRG_08479 [Hirsutella rhossiliensis]KAH0960324.1 hypothetical protein HRG_08479 [Hirsutella rhossiliensis]
MVSWVKILSIYVLSTMALLATVAGTGGRRRDMAFNMSLDTVLDAPGADGNSSTRARRCAQLGATLNKTAELFTRQLTREEYYARNFMWIRCRSMGTKWFDMGGAWFGRDGKDLEARFWGIPMAEWRFNYVKGNWGDATLFFNEYLELSFDNVMKRIRDLTDVASERYKRNLYIIDCPGQRRDPYFATERKGVIFPNPKMVQPVDGNRAYYNAEKMSKQVGQGFPSWPKKHPKTDMLKNKKKEGTP